MGTSNPQRLVGQELAALSTTAVGNTKVNSNLDKLINESPESTNIEDRRTKDDKRYEDLSSKRDKWIRENKGENYDDITNGPLSYSDYRWMLDYETEKIIQSYELTMEELNRQLGMPHTAKGDIPIPKPRR